jgi:4-amino-4-deoxy-L-arabinose transferase-like glycosyltransferase
MGSPIIHPKGTWLTQELTGIRTHTYWIMPGYLLLQAVWYWLFGFGIFQMRAISICAGLCVIWAWAFIVWKVTRNRVATYLTAVILASDITFLKSATDGRMDMTTVAFGSLGLASFLSLREKSLMVALVVANFCVGAAIYCHPNGIIYAFLLCVFVVYFDRSRIRLKHAGSLAAYTVFAGAWLAYILERPDYFMAQFKANATSPMVNRMAGLRHPLVGIAEEATKRYLEHFGGHFGGLWFWAQLPGFTRVIPLLYWALVFWVAFQNLRKKNPRALFIAAVAASTFLFMGVAIAHKAPNYLTAIMPLYAACAGVAICPFSGKINRIPLAMLSVLLSANGVAIAVSLHHDDYRDGYLPAVKFLKAHATPTTPINGTSALLFDLPGYRLTDDARLHDPAEYIAVDLWRTLCWRLVFKLYEPAMAAEVERKLTAYKPVFEHNGWTIFQRIE